MPRERSSSGAIWSWAPRSLQPTGSGVPNNRNERGDREAIMYRSHAEDCVYYVYPGSLTIRRCCCKLSAPVGVQYECGVPLCGRRLAVSRPFVQSVKSQSHGHSARRCDYNPGKRFTWSAGGNASRKPASRTEISRQEIAEVKRSRIRCDWGQRSGPLLQATRAWLYDARLPN